MPHNFQVPSNAPIEDKIICDLVNKGFDTQQLFRAAFTFHSMSVEQKLIKGGRLIVRDGIFKGQLLYPNALHSQLLPKIMGTYEIEVQRLLVQELPNADCFLNIGCAEGFYVVGVARSYGIASCGFDIDRDAESALLEGAKMNNVRDLVSFSGSIRELISKAGDNTCILIDVDGSEISVLRDLELCISDFASQRKFTLVIETDRDSNGLDNTSMVTKELVSSGWQVLKMVDQDPSLRFPRFTDLQLSMLDSVTMGCEGRPANQRWILANRAPS